jgi:hypothetical protein
MQLLTQMVFFGEIHVFLQLSLISPFVQTEPIATWKTVICRKYLLQTLIQFSLGNNVLMLLLLTEAVVFGETHVFLQIS